MIVSIIIPVYNTGHYLNRCVDSILSQGINEELFEIVIIDDGSKDDSAEVIKKIAKGRDFIKTISTENQGLGAARNTAMKASEGKYIFFVDSDDYLFEGSLKELVEYAEFASFSIIGFNWAQVFSDSSIRTQKRNDDVYNKVWSRAEYLNQYNLNGSVWSYLFLASFLKETPILMPEGIYHEDEIFLPHAFASANQVVFLDLLVYAYCHRSNSIMNDKKLIDKRIVDSLHILDELSSLMKSSEFNDFQKQAIQRKLHFFVVDFILNLIYFRADRITIDHITQELQNRGLYPLAKQSYSQKYNLFRAVFSKKINIVMAAKIGLFRKK